MQLEMRMVLAHKINFCVRMESLTEQEWRVLLHKIARRLVNVTDRKMVLVFTFTTAFHLCCLLFRVKWKQKDLSDIETSASEWIYQYLSHSYHRWDRSTTVINWNTLFLRSLLEKSIEFPMNYTRSSITIKKNESDFKSNVYDNDKHTSTSTYMQLPSAASWGPDRDWLLHYIAAFQVMVMVNGSLASHKMCQPFYDELYFAHSHKAHSQRNV